MTMTTDDARRVDIRSLKQDGMLKPGTVGEIRWSRGGKQTSSVGFTTHADCLELAFSYQELGGKWIPHVDYGGTRPWFLCPGCARRVAVVFGIRRDYRCRHCHRLPYTSQHEGERDRMLRRAQTIRARLGVSANLLEPIWHKPKGMHWKTFQRLRDEEQRLSQSFIRGALERVRG